MDRRNSLGWLPRTPWRRRSAGSPPIRRGDLAAGTAPPLAGTPEQIAEGIDAFAAAGLDHLVAGVRWVGDPTYDGAVDALETVAAELLDAAHSHG